MAAVSSGFLESLLNARGATESGSAWLGALRAQALERANALSVPNTRDEEWRFTDLAPLTRLSFQPVAQAPAVASEQLQAFRLDEALARFVFVDGVLSAELSSLPSAPAGVRWCDLRSAVSEPAVEGALGRLADGERHLFPALNTAFLRDGAVVLLAPQARLGAPIHILHVATRRECAQALYPRTLVVAGRDSAGTVIEDFVALGDGGYFSAPVCEIALAPGAAVTHVRWQRESTAAFHLGTCAVRQRSASRYMAVSVATGARLSRLDWNIVQADAGCETELHGLALIGGRQLADTHSAVDHATSQGRLRQLHKCVVAGGAHAVFNGKILVRAGAQQTDAAQACRGLLLSERSRIDAKPQLEIFTDDVKCAHGAAIGQLDAEAAFYLRSRGLSEHGARHLLTYAFAAEVIERIPSRALRAALTQTLMDRTQEQA